MNQSITMSRQGLGIVAIARIIFSILLVVIVMPIRISIPCDLQGAGAWLSSNSRTVNLAFNLVIPDRLGELGDRLFVTIFLGSRLLFLAMLFASAAVLGGIIETYIVYPKKW